MYGEHGENRLLWEVKHSIYGDGTLSAKKGVDILRDNIGFATTTRITSFTPHEKSTSHSQCLTYLGKQCRGSARISVKGEGGREWFGVSRVCLNTEVDSPCWF